MHRLCFRFSSCSVSSPSRSVVKVSSRHRNLSTCLRVMSNLDPNAAYKSEVDTLGHLDTKVIKIDPTRVDEEEAKFEVPTSLIRKGEVVAFPTETVYGLGANALDASAVSKIFKTKKRPSDNPLIVHVSDKKMLAEVAQVVPADAKKLMDKFWPGPLTILFQATPKVPKEVTCGLPTVAIRMPAHPIALKLIALSGVPIAAPSANLSGRPSPTLAEHVYTDLKGRCECIVDGGPTAVGLESTVVNVEKKMILRPGGITLEQLKEIIPDMKVFSPESDVENTMLRPPTPGLKYRHYSPDAGVLLLLGTSMEKMRNFILEKINQFSTDNKKLGIIHTHPKSFNFSEVRINPDRCFIITLGDGEAIEVAKGLFAALRDLDSKGVDMIIMEGISEENEGMAVMNRIKKAAENTVNVDME